LRCHAAKERRLPTSNVTDSCRPIQPKYADSFRCIGSACEDTCCAGWTVPIDRATWKKYQSLPESPLRVLPLQSLIAANVVRNAECADSEASSGAAFATIRMNSANQCPMLSEERLCRIQAELGEDLLSHACATYPRIVHSLGGMEEKALSLSCPEAARLVLLTPNLFADAEYSGPAGGVSPSAAAGAAAALPPHFWPIRAVVLKLVGNRLYPLWQRLFLLDILCRRLDSITRGDLKRSIPTFLAGFEATLASGALRAGMDALPTGRAAQLDVVLRLAGLMLHKSNIRPRFVECIQAFTAGIGNGPGATLESLAAHYSFAHDRLYAPFMDRHPHIMENFLINTILRCQFPYGKDGMRAGAQTDMAREFSLLAAQFALMRGLLIGVAGHHGPAFSGEHIVHTVQAASKHFEHHPEFLPMAHALLVESRIDGPSGLAMLLRNPKMNQGVGESSPASAQILAAGWQDGISASAPAQQGLAQSH
jgi:lysine-N-methylase